MRVFVFWGVLLFVCSVCLGCEGDSSVSYPVATFNVSLEGVDDLYLKNKIEVFVEKEGFDEPWAHPNPPSIGVGHAEFIQYSRKSDDVEIIVENIVNDCLEISIYSKKNVGKASDIFMRLKGMVYSYGSPCVPSNNAE